MNLQYQKSPSGYPVLFYEKHVHTITTIVTVSTLKEAAKKASSGRTFGGQGAALSSIMCMSLGQSEAMFSWLLKNKAKELTKVSKPDLYDIGGIPVFGAIVTNNTKTKKLTARSGGTITLGFVKATASIISIAHFGGHDWDGSKTLADTDSVDPKTGV